MRGPKKETPKIELRLLRRDQTTPLTPPGRATRASNFGRGNTQAKRLREGSATNSLKLYHNYIVSYYQPLREEGCHHHTLRGGRMVTTTI